MPPAGAPAGSLGGGSPAHCPLALAARRLEFQVQREGQSKLELYRLEAQRLPAVEPVTQELVPQPF